MEKLLLPITIIVAFTITSCDSREKTTSTTTEEKTCFYSFDKTATTIVRWTAFKTEAKATVGGQFDRVNVTGGMKSTKITDVLETIKFSIPTASVNTANEERDTKIVKSFFGAMNQTDIILGQVKSVVGNNENGTCIFYLIINNIEKEATLTYTVEDATIKLVGEIDINNWNGQTALASLNNVCSEKHKGDGKESITWPNIELSIETTLKKVCH